jgi:hypothetical protein
LASSSVFHYKEKESLSTRRFSVADSPKDFYNLNMRFWILLLLPLLLPQPAWAQFGFHAGSHFGYGGMRSDSGSRPQRDMGTWDFQFMPGYRFPPLLMAGLLLDYRFMSQLTDKSQVGSDYSGRGFLWGLGLTAEPGLFKLLVSYDFRARHWFSGPDTTFKGSGYHLLFGYKFMPGFFADLEYVSTTYNSQEVDGISSGLKNDDLHHWNLGLGISYSY